MIYAQHVNRTPFLLVAPCTVAFSLHLSFPYSNAFCFRFTIDQVCFGHAIFHSVNVFFP